MKKAVIVFIIILLCYACRMNTKEADNITDLHINVNDTTQLLDISFLFQDSFDIVPLETSSELLISEISKIEYRNGLYYVADEVSQAVFIFDGKGEYKSTVGKRGGGPGEYITLGSFTLQGDDVLIQAKFQGKVLVYDQDGRYKSTIDVKEIPHLQFEAVGRSLFFVTEGSYHLTSMDADRKTIHHHLPIANKAYSDWGLNSYIDAFGDTAFLILPRDNTIYEVTATGVTPIIKVHFSERTPPLEFLNRDGGEVLVDNLEKGYILGMNRVVCSENFLFLTYSDKRMSKQMLFDRRNSDYRICDWMVLRDLGDLYVNDNYSTTTQGDFVFAQEAIMYKTAWERIYSNMTFKNVAVREKMEALYHALTHDSNPVIFRFKYK